MGGTGQRFPNTFLLHSPLLSPIQPHVGKGAPCNYLRSQAPSNQAICTTVWGRGFLGRQSYLWFYPFPFITRRNNKIETFVWKTQWKSGKERGREGMGQATPQPSPTGDPSPGSRVLELVGQCGGQFRARLHAAVSTAVASLWPPSCWCQQLPVACRLSLPLLAGAQL